MNEYSVGIDLGGTNIACGVVDDNGNIILKKSIPTGAKRPYGEILDDMALLVKDTVSEAKLSMNDIKFCGIASPGIANIETGVIEYSCNFPTFTNTEIVKELKARLGIDNIAVENDANAAGIGEALVGAAKGTKDSVFITLGTGVGGAVIIGGKLLRGINFTAAELGHIVIEANGRNCPCGRKGCWETYSSATGLINMTKEKMLEDKSSMLWEFAPELEKVNGTTAFKAYYKGDGSAKEVVEKYIFYLALGLTNIANIFEPEIISIGGGICGEGENLLGPVREILNKEIYARDCKKKPKLVKAQLGNDAGLIGAALLWKA